MNKYQEALKTVGDRLVILRDVWDEYADNRRRYEEARRRHSTPDNAVASLVWLGHATRVYKEARVRLRSAHHDYKKAMRHFLEYKLD